MDGSVGNGEIAISWLPYGGKDRNQCGGGVILYFHEWLSYEVLSDLSDLEMIITHIKLPHFHPLLVGTVYCPPDCLTFYDNLDKIPFSDTDF